MRNKYLLFKPPDYGILLWQPEPRQVSAYYEPLTNGGGGGVSLEARLVIYNPCWTGSLSEGIIASVLPPDPALNSTKIPPAPEKR